jgi:hypothetical protein
MWKPAHTVVGGISLALRGLIEECGKDSFSFD